MFWRSVAFLCPSFSFVQYIWVSISGLGSLFSSTFVVFGFLFWGLYMQVNYIELLIDADINPDDVLL